MIDQRDYQLAVNQAQATLAQAQVALQTEQQQAQIALEEWRLLEMADKGEPDPLVLREPQLQRERANLAAAQAGLEKAELNLQRCTPRSTAGYAMSRSTPASTCAPGPASRPWPGPTGWRSTYRCHWTNCSGWIFRAPVRALQART